MASLVTGPIATIKRRMEWLEARRRERQAAGQPSGLDGSEIAALRVALACIEVCRGYAIACHGGFSIKQQVVYTAPSGELGRWLGRDEPLHDGMVAPGYGWGGYWNSNYGSQ